MKVILHLILLVVTGMASAQQKHDTLASLDLPVSDDFKIDQYGQVYLLQQDQLLKLNAKGEHLYSFSDPLLGEIEDIDVFDPLALYLFYEMPPGWWY
ncbi:MAG: hypothetical protein U5L96_14950 [Owenweeksia sp.]|nr:hypothetical protein [Owenweeksia sp.]